MGIDYLLPTLMTNYFRIFLPTQNLRIDSRKDDVGVNNNNSFIQNDLQMTLTDSH